MAAPILTAARLREVLHYDPETGYFKWALRISSKCPSGKLAGTITHWGYAHTKVDKEGHYCHRLAWLYMTGGWPQHDVDHINGVRHDNRWANLRDVTRRMNLQNQHRARKGKASGAPLGVVRAGNRFAAQITVNGVLKHIGTFGETAAAHEAYLAAKRELHEGCTI